MNKLLGVFLVLRLITIGEANLRRGAGGGRETIYRNDHKLICVLDSI